MIRPPFGSHRNRFLLVFATRGGEPPQPDDLSKEFTETMNDIGLPHVTLHTLRHTYASQPITSGMDILTVSRRLVHSSAAITLTVYGHLPSPKDDATAIMQAAFARTRRATGRGRSEITHRASPRLAKDSPAGRARG